MLGNSYHRLPDSRLPKDPGRLGKPKKNCPDLLSVFLSEKAPETKNELIKKINELLQAMESDRRYDSSMHTAEKIENYIGILEGRFRVNVNRYKEELKKLMISKTTQKIEKYKEILKKDKNAPIKDALQNLISKLNELGGKC